MSGSGAGVLPACIINDTIYFLFGKENRFADTPGWSDFGGGQMGNETPLRTAIREGKEELTGILGDFGPILGQGYHKIYAPKFDYTMHIFPFDYDEKLVQYFNNTHAFLESKLSDKQLRDSKIFEKCEIRWFSFNDMLKKRNSFRSYFREIVDILRDEKGNIRTFLKNKNKNKNKNKTRKH
jgi:8-oxo-dGTP pyrophosphatase MutT (NUDIX family)